MVIVIKKLFDDGVLSEKEYLKTKKFLEDKEAAGENIVKEAAPALPVVAILNAGLTTSLAFLVKNLAPAIGIDLSFKAAAVLAKLLSATDFVNFAPRFKGVAIIPGANPAK